MKILTCLLILGVVVICAYLLVELVFYVSSKRKPKREFGCAIREGD